MAKNERVGSSPIPIPAGQREARPPGQDPALDVSASASVGPSEIRFSFSLKISSERLAAGALVGCAVTALWSREPELVYGAVQRALEALGAHVQNIIRGSILVEMHCDTKEGLLSFVEAFDTKKVKQRLEEEFRKIGFEEELEVTITNEKEVYEKVNQIRQERKKEEVVEEVGESSGEETFETSGYSTTDLNEGATALPSTPETIAGLSLSTKIHQLHRNLLYESRKISLVDVMAENERASSQPIPILAGQGDQHRGAPASSPIQESSSDQQVGAEALSPPQGAGAGQHAGVVASSPIQDCCADQQVGEAASSPQQESSADQHTGAVASSPIQESCADPPHAGAASPLSIQETIAGALRDLSHLPQTVPHFVSRFKECEDIKRYLCPTHSCSCVLVHGVTGVGKTSTAIKVANERLDSDSRTVVVYVNCRYINSLDDFSEKALQQVYHYPVENPISELKNRLKSQDFYTVSLLDDFEFLLHLGETRHELEGRVNPASEESKVMTFITEIVMISRKVKLLVTSSEKVVFPELGQEMIHLPCFTPEESLQLLQIAWKDGVVNQQHAYQLAKICSGIPLVLYTLALSHRDQLSLVKHMTSSLPQEKFDLLRKIQSVPKEEKIVSVCLDFCFGRLTEQEKKTLITLALLRGRFTLSGAAQIFRSTALSEHQLTDSALELAKRSLLEENIIGGTCLYTFLRVISDYCRNKKSDFPVVFANSRNLFIDYFLAFLNKTFRTFLSKKASGAIADFRQEEENVMQLIEWCENGEMDEQQATRVIDVFNSVGELLAKMIGKTKYKSVFASLRKKCEGMEDQKRLSECLTSLGIKEVFHCSCSPGLCDEAAGRAREYLVEADRIQSSPDLSINTGNSRAQCLAKLGRCLAKEGKFREGRDKIQQAIDIRHTYGEEDIVMLAATYNDMAVALSLDQKHRQAIEVREQQTLPIYREKLCNHPFTATILNNLSNNYYALGEYDNAKRYSEEALMMRLDLLKDHRDTAKSLFDLGMVHKEREEFRQARDCFEKSMEMQRKVLDDNIKDLQRTRDELEELCILLASQDNELD